MHILTLCHLQLSPLRLNLCFTFMYMDVKICPEKTVLTNAFNQSGFSFMLVIIYRCVTNHIVHIVLSCCSWFYEGV